jgi:hypothetical protein
MKQSGRTCTVRGDRIDIVQRLRAPVGELGDREEAAETIEFLRKLVAELEERVAEDDARWSRMTISAARQGDAQ